MRTGKRTQDYHFIKTQTDALYYAADIPSVNWGSPSSTCPSFRMIIADDYSVRVPEQEKWYKSLQSGDMFSVPYLVLLSSYVDDSLALSLGYDLMKTALHKHRVQVTNSAGVPEEKTNDETVFMLTNLYDGAPNERMQSVRDWCFRHNESFRVVCASGDPTIIVNKLRLKFNAVFYVEDPPPEELSYA